MTDVVIAGVGQTPVGEHWNTSIRELALQSIEGAILDSGGIQPQALFVSNMLAPTISGQANLATLVADFAGLNGVEAVAIEGSGASGGMALRQAYMLVAAGAADAVLVSGIEKITDKTGSGVEAAISTAVDSDYEAVHGLTPTAQAALLMGRYLHEFDLGHESLAGFPVTAHANGVSNPNAMFRRAIKVEAYTRSGSASDQLNMFDIAPNADGSAALLLTRRDLLPPAFAQPLVRISGSSAVSDTLALHDRPDPLTFQAARQSAERALRQAGILPADIDLFELFDAFSIYAALSLEAAGFAERGAGWQLAQDNHISLDGSLPISTFGGLKARGNPGGATGVYQVVEAVTQLRGHAGDNQVKDARRAMVQSLGGPASAAATHVLERVE
jgi:acetyl-CoA C-acetyltransferase